MNYEEGLSLCQKMRVCGWRQGSLFLASPQDIDCGQSAEKVLYVLVTHSCDVLQESFEKEPYAEAIFVKKIPIQHNAFINGKNPRKIHIKLSCAGKDCWYEFSLAKRVFFDRKKLASLKPLPDYKIKDDKDLENLIRLLADKYDRVAFPDTFKKRIGSGEDKIRDILKKDGEDILGLLIDLNSHEELDAMQPYEIRLFMIIDKNQNDEDIKFLDILDRIVSKLDVKGINVSESMVTKLEKMTAQEYLDMKYWSFDDLCYGDEQQGKMINRRNH